MFSVIQLKTFGKNNIKRLRNACKVIILESEMLSKHGEIKITIFILESTMVFPPEYKVPKNETRVEVDVVIRR